MLPFAAAGFPGDFFFFYQTSGKKYRMTRFDHSGDPLGTKRTLESTCLLSDVCLELRHATALTTRDMQDC